MTSIYCRDRCRPCTIVWRLARRSAEVIDDLSNQALRVLAVAARGVSEIPTPPQSILHFETMESGRIIIILINLGLDETVLAPKWCARYSVALKQRNQDRAALLKP